MTRAIAFPTTLPGISTSSLRRAERAAFSEVRGAGRLRMRDKSYEFDAEWEVPFNLAIQFKAWYEVDLIHGQRICAIPLPGVGGILPRVCQFKEPVQRELIPGIGYRYSTTLIVRGLAR